MEKVLEIAKKLENTCFQEQYEWIVDFNQYFGQQQYLDDIEDAKKLIQDMEEKLLVLSEQSRFGFSYLSSYFKSGQNDQTNSTKEIIAKNIKQLCFIFYQNKKESSHSQKQKQILIQEYLSLHSQIQQVAVINELKLQKIKEIYNFKTKLANEFYQKYLQEFMSKQGNNNKVFWTDFKSIFEKYLKELFSHKYKNDFNYGDLASYLKQFIDKKEDNEIDLEEIDDFYFEYLNKDSFSLDDLYKIIEKRMYKPLNTNLKITMIKYPTTYSIFYHQNGIEFQIKPYQDHIQFGRKADKQNTIQMFPENDSNMSRQQFQICKDEMQNYYIENMHKNILLLIRVTSVKQIVRKGFTYHFPKKNKVLVEDITPNQQIYSEGISQINPALDWCQVDLKANISQPEAQNTNDQEYEIYFKYNNIQYHCRSSKFTIGNSLSDDIQIETAELGEQIVFQYIDNYGWVVYEPKSTNIGTFVNPNFSDIQKNQETLKLQKNDSDSNLVANNQQINPKFLIFDGIQFQLADYEFRLNFQK